MNLGLFSACLLLGTILSIKALTVDQSLEEIVREKCLEKRGYKVLDDNMTYFRVVEVVGGAEVTLPCSYCGEYVEDSARVWRWLKRTADSTEQDVQLGMGANLTNNRVFTLPDHSLTVRNVSSENTGMYYCRSLEEDDAVVFQFSLDVVLSEVPVEKETEDLSWEVFVGSRITKVNKGIHRSDSAELKGLLDKVLVRVTSEWDPWQACDGCRKERKRFSKCRVGVKLNRIKYPNMKDVQLNTTERLLYTSMAVSCHSLHLAVWFPTLFSLTSQTPNFLQTRMCYGDCEKIKRLNNEAKYYLNVDLNEGDTQFFICPGTDLRNKIVWRKNGVELKQLRHQGKSRWGLIQFGSKKSKATGSVFVDRMNMLHLSHVTVKDSAEYVCYNNKLAVKGFNVTVTSADETQRRRFYHFWLLSVYSALLSTVIVLLGVLWGCCNKDVFLQIPDEPLMGDDEQ